MRLMVLAAKNIVLSGENFKLDTKSANLANLTIVVRVVTAMNYLLRKNAWSISLPAVDTSFIEFGIIYTLFQILHL